MNSTKGFTMLEVLLVIAVGMVLISVIIRAVDPATRLKQARDAKRKTDISILSNAITQYQSSHEEYPADVNECDSSKGTAATCPANGTNWDINQGLYKAIVSDTQILKQLPTDPINNQDFYYSYEPLNGTESPCNTEAHSKVCRYWIGARLEKPFDPTKLIFRCSDRTDLPAGAGCKEVENWNQ